MRILYCNKYNYLFSGTESYLFDLMRRVDARGHATALFSMEHGEANSYPGRCYLVPRVNFKDPRAGLPKKVWMAAHAVYSPSARRRMRNCLRDFRPELAHIRGIYNHLSTSILWELKKQGVPVVYHVNDFKILCPNYNLVANGRACEACKDGNFFHAVTRGCYAGPWTNATVLALEAYIQKWMRTYQRCIDLFIAPSQFVREKLAASGIDATKITLLPHFQILPREEEIPADQGYVLYFGRRSPEKGVAELLHAMVALPHIPLIIAGDGPERPRLEWMARDLNLKNVVFVGNLTGEQLAETIAGACFSVFPSHAYETLGKSILESYAWSRPVVATDLGSRREFVEHGVTGLLYRDGDRKQLTDAIALLFDRGDLTSRLGIEGRRRLQQKHDPEKHLDAMLDIYARLAAHSRQSVALHKAVTPPSHGVRVAFIGGRGVIGKYSGIESCYEEVGPELVRLGNDVTIYCRTYFTPPMNRYQGMRLFRLPTIRSKHLETVVHTFLSSLDAMFRDYDVVHYHSIGSALFSFLPRLTGKKTVVTVQGLDWQRRKWGPIASAVLKLSARAAVSFPNATMVVSQTLQDYVRREYQCITFYAPNGARRIEPSVPRNLKDWGLSPNRYVLYLGRFSPEKNCHVLIDAFKRVRTEMKLVLAGGSNHTDSYTRQLMREQSDQIKFLPWQKGAELDELLKNAALFVLPSDLEGLSLALLEAMAAGVCALTSDIPENKELVDGVGFTFRRGDAVHLERMLAMLLHDPEMRRQPAWRFRGLSGIIVGPESPKPSKTFTTPCSAGRELTSRIPEFPFSRPLRPRCPGRLVITAFSRIFD
jgi:glycosyltransferase involved in cell wall biosynthesis